MSNANDTVERDDGFMAFFDTGRFKVYDTRSAAIASGAALVVPTSMPTGRNAEYVFDRNLDMISTALADGMASERVQRQPK